MASALNPDEILCTTAQKANFQRLTRLLICGGTSLLRETFDQHCPPSHLPTSLSNPATETLLKKAKLTKPQWECLYPSPGVYGESKDFDLTLLFKLLRTICGLAPPPTGWDASPATSDLSLAADLVRIKNFRNTVYGHVHEAMEITNDHFSLLWIEIKETLLRIAGRISPARKSNWQEAINKFLRDPLTKKDERNVQELERWYEEDVEVKKSLKDLKISTVREIEGLKDETQKMNSELGEIRQLLDGLGSNPTAASNITAAVLPLTINCETTPEQSKQNGIPSTQAILNLVASKYLKNVDPSTPEEFNGFVRYLHEVRKVLIVGTHSGSLIIKVKCSTLAILEDLWDDYCTGHLNEMAQKYLVTEEILKILGVAELILTTNISEEKYRECQEHFLNFHGLELDNGNTTGSGEESAETNSDEDDDDVDDDMVTTKVKWKTTEASDFTMDESKELGVENEVSDDETDDEPKEPAYHHDTTGDSPPWIKGEQHFFIRAVTAMAVGVVAAAAGAVAAPVIVPPTLKVAIFMFGHGHLISPIAGAQAAHFATFQSSGACTEVANAVLAGATGLIAGFAAALGSFELLGRRRRSDTLKLVICGSGNGAHLFACIASSRKDTDVRVLNLHEDDAKRWETAMQQKKLEVAFLFQGEKTYGIVSKLEMVTKNPEDAMRDAEMVVFMMQPSYHQHYLEALATHIKPGTVIVGLSGYPEFESQVCHVLGEKAQQCTIMNFESSPWTCRTTETGVACKVVHTMETLQGNIMKGNVPPKKDPVAALQYLLGPLPELKVSNGTDND